MRPYVQLLWGNHDYFKLWLSGAISQLGDWFNTIVLMSLVSIYTDGSGLAVSLFLLARIVPPLVITPYAGVLADRFNRKQIMILADVLRAIVVLMFLLGTGRDTLGLIYILTVAQFTLTALYEPARSAILPNLVKHDDLIIANTIGSITWSAMLAIGALVGGIVAGALGMAVALVIDAVTYLLSAILTLRIKSYHAPVANSTATSATSSSQSNQFIEGLRYARAHPDVAMALLVKAGGRFGSTEAVMTIFATQIFASRLNSETSLGILYGALGIGAVAGPLILNYVHDGSVRQMQRAIAWGFMLLVLGWGVVSQAPALLIVAVGLAIRSMGGSANWTYSSAIIQHRANDAFMGRMFSLETSLMNLIGIVSTIGTGLLIDWVGAGNVHAVAGVLAVTNLVPLAVWIVLVRFSEAQRGKLSLAGSV